MRWHLDVRSWRRVAALTVGLAVVGTFVGSGVAGALAPWKIVASPNISGQNNVLESVSCSGSAECVAVGQSNAQTLIESWNGSGWSIVPSPDTSPTADNLLWGVSCSGPSACTAVGSVAVGADYQTLIESWNGTTWSIVPSPSTSPTENTLLAVSCYDLTHCMAVGSAQVGTNGLDTLTESWDGTTWSIVPSPDVSTSTYEELSGVSCTGPTDCTAVGFFDTDGVQTLIESWDGTTWSIVPSPDPTSFPGLYGDSLDAVSCASSTACVAVGGNNTIDSHSVVTLIESWDGTTWSVVPSPNGRGMASSLGGVSCVTPGSCNAVGGSFGGVDSSTLIESWNGSKWSAVRSPNRGHPSADFLGGVSCVNSTNCTAVGQSGNSSSETLVESMQGTPPKFSGPAPGQVTCSLTAKVSFSPPVTDSSGATTTTVKGELTNCTATAPGLSITSGKLTGSFPGPATGCAALGAGDMPATVAIGWKGQYNPPDDSVAGKASLTDSTVTVTGEQEVTDGLGDVGFVVPGAGNAADTGGSFAAVGPNGASVTVSSEQTASQLSALCSPTPRTNKPPKPAKGIKKLTLTGSVTLG
jgi:hypothetical protein